MSSRLSFFWLLFLAVLFACGGVDAPHRESPVPDEVGYNLHVRPILSENCFTCHGPDANKREAGLRLDLAEDAYAALKENPGAHAIMPGKPKVSEAYRRIASKDPLEVMPPPESNLQLSDREIRMIEKWIRQGAVYEPHWAFVPPEKTPLPDIKNKEWPSNELDYFILAAQEKAGLKPNPLAGKEMLLRRLSFDLTGLPPGLELMEKFLANDDVDAEERLIDHLLSQKSYGEKMAVHWMDVARYADSHGYQDDYFRTQWPWRDWVIHAFNQNMAYDEFVTWQLAGDLLPNPTKEQLLATGFNRNHKITEESGAIDEEYRVMYVVDRTNTLGKALLGITMECAQCHDHKYDPISQKEYFQLYAFFNNVAEYGIEESRPGFSKKSPAKFPLMEITNEDVEGILSFVNMPDSASRVKAIMGEVDKGDNFHALASEAAALKVSIMGDLDTLRKTFLLERGDYEAHREEVFHGTPETILPFPDDFPKNRLGLARWLFDQRNPLTARVFVNRIWQEFFGKGLVGTTGDFGMQGELPTHPELLDWLAVDFMENGWDIHHLIRKIVTSSAYRQSSVVDDKKRAKDPDNRLLARFPRNRLSAEEIRDMVMASSGLLVPEIGGPSVKPYQPEGLWEAATSGRGNLSSYKQDTGGALYRRGLYTFIKRTVPPPSMILFDASNRDECEVERTKTNTPLQALVMMNDPTVLEASRVLAAKLLKESSTELEKIHKAFQLIIGRRADEKELEILEGYYREQQQSLKDDHDRAKKLIKVGEYPLASDVPEPAQAAMMLLVQTIYNMEEAITKS
ncbi:PSD1 and planctomycete cytochrome C domain-containing protein [Negadavirga shengliensis]|uniref:PSD1 and planctomycete cytochrome C domain-containing protein n=1 Tax=Negadavirga shengliensis TaxID=1389218 RepID=A0ABV9SXD8_9BACT